MFSYQKLNFLSSGNTPWVSQGCNISVCEPKRDFILVAKLIFSILRKPVKTVIIKFERLVIGSHIEFQNEDPQGLILTDHKSDISKTER